MTKKEAEAQVVLLLDKEGFNLMKYLTRKELLRILIAKDWIGAEGKLGYEPLMRKYSISHREIRTICSKIKGV